MRRLAKAKKRTMYLRSGLILIAGLLLFALVPSDMPFLSRTNPAGWAEAEETGVPEATASIPVVRVVKIELDMSTQPSGVKIVTTGKVGYSQKYLANPNRLLLVLKNSRLPRMVMPNPASGGPLLNIRAAQHGRDVWVVLDLADTGRWQVRSQWHALVLVPAGSAAATPEVMPPIQTGAIDHDGQPQTNGVNNLLAAGPVVSATYQVVDVNAESLGEKTRLTVTTDGMARYRVKGEKLGRELVLQIFGAGLSGQLSVPGLPRGVIVQASVRQTSENNEPVVEIRTRLTAAAGYQISREQNQIMLDFNNLGAMIASRGNLNAQISVDFENANLDSVLRALAQQAGFDLVMTPESQNKAGNSVTVTITEQPLKQVLDYLLRPSGLSYTALGNTLRVGLATEFPTETLVFTLRNADVKNPSFKTSLESSLTPGSQGKVAVDEHANRVIISAIPGDMARIKEVIANLDTRNNVNTRNFRLTYSQAHQLAPLLQSQLSSLGSIKDDASQNMLVVTDIPGNLERISQAIRSLDIKAQQIMIEARIVELSLASEQDLVQWKNDLRNAGAGQDESTGHLNAGVVVGGRDLNTALSLLESKGLANTIANPRIATLNNQSADIHASRNIPYHTSVVSNGVVSNGVQYLELPITLSVTPRVSNGQVMLNPLTLTVAAVVGDQNPPETTTRSATTQMVVGDGETVVLGGLVRNEEHSQPTQVPVLGDIPLIGGLFRGAVLVKHNVELVVFLTPHILK